MKRRAILTLAMVAGLAAPGMAQDDAKDEPKESLTTGDISALGFRLIGPALMSGRITDIAVNPENHSEWFVAVACGGVWHTESNGTTFKPVFDNYPSYSIGCVTIDPSNPDVVWVGTGENNSQRSVAWGDGIYKSIDGGESFKKMGLDDSQHIGRIAVHPDDSDTVYVASQGPLWNAGGDRGLYRTTDGGETWERILHISDDTGINEVFLDPSDPDTIYASAYQRRRRVWTLINGGPESGLWKSTDGGTTWREINRGLPGGDKGRIGLAISPANPKVLHAIVEAAGGGGFYRSENGGENWSKQSGYVSVSPQYYNELLAHPHDPDTVYVHDTYTKVTRDGGKTFESILASRVHVDSHALWVDPTDPSHMILGNDGGVYQTWDNANSWMKANNLPLTQFYRVAVDNDAPFYNIYGGTQDNNTIGGPSRTHYADGILNEDWFVTVGGDGFETAVDPENPDIVYSQWQYGGLIRFDRSSGELADIKPRERAGEDPYVFNWDAPLMISPHNNARLYFGGRRLHRSDDQGSSWRPVSGDLTRQIDRNTLEVMGTIQKPEAVAKHDSTSIYGNLVALDESPLVEGLIYAGTDDGHVQVTQDGGETWTATDSFPGVPEQTYVAQLTASLHDENVVFGVFNNHKSGDFTPYVMRSDDRGATWTSITGDLEAPQAAWSIEQDHEDPDLLFLGTEFGAYTSVDGGEHWTEIPGLPTIAVRDVEIQRRESDLVLATFGRGFYVLDDYSALRTLTPAMVEADESMVFPIRSAPIYVEANKGRGYMGSALWSVENPGPGPVITYLIGDAPKTKKAERLEAQKEDDWAYPTLEDFRAESLEAPAETMLVIRDDEFEVVARMSVPGSEGLHRVTWDMRLPALYLAGDSPNFGGGPLATPGIYSVTLDRLAGGEMTRLAGPQEFELFMLGNNTFEAADHDEAMAFKQRVNRLWSRVASTGQVASDAEDRLARVTAAAKAWPGAGESLLARAESIRLRMAELMLELRGDSVASGQDLPTLPSIQSRVLTVMWGNFESTIEPTGTHREQYEIASDLLDELLPKLSQLIETDLEQLERDVAETGAPWTPGLGLPEPSSP